MAKKALYFVVTAFVCLGLGFFIGLAAGKKADTQSKEKTVKSEKSESAGTFQDGWKAARKKLLDSDFFTMMGGKQLLSGKVASVEGNRIIFNANPMTPLDGKDLEKRTAIAAEDTKIIYFQRKTPEEMSADNEQAQAKVKELEKQLEAAGSEEEKNRISNEIMSVQMNMGAPEKRVEIKVGDIKPGMLIEARAGEDISSKPEFKAVEIIVRDEVQEGPKP